MSLTNVARTRSVPAHRSRSQARMWQARGWTTSVPLLVLIVGLAVAGERQLAHWLVGVGVPVSGDQPTYMTQAQALLRGTVHTSGVFAQDLARHYFAAYPSGAKITTSQVFEHFPGPHGSVSPFEPGLSILIAPFLGAWGQPGAFVALFILEAAGLCWLHRRVTALCRLNWRAQLFLAVALVSPAVAVAGTQIYPDLISGIILAVVLVEVAWWEREGLSGYWSLVVIAVGSGFLPWLQVKNVVAAGAAILAFGFVAWRRRAPRSQLAVALVIVAIMWALLGAYNLRYFGHLSGFPEPSPVLNHAGLVRTLGLLFDRHQGLVIELPTVVLGMLGARAAFRKVPASLVAAAVAAGSVLFLNGTYASNPYGGFTLAGRFEWTLMPVLVAFGGFALEAWQGHGRALLRGSIVLLALWGVQAYGLTFYEHSLLYFNQQTGWDPAAYPGWWPWLNHLLPEYILTRHIFGQPEVGTLLAIALAFAVTFVPALPLGEAWAQKELAPLAVGAGVIALSAAVLIVDNGPGFPGYALHYPGAALGAPLTAPGKAGATGPAVALNDVIPGTYHVAASYTVAGSRPAQLVVFCNATPAAVLRRRSLPPGGHHGSLSITCLTQGAIIAELTTPAHSSLQLHQLTLTKTGLRPASS